jgi:hypothetical protein
MKLRVLGEYGKIKVGYCSKQVSEYAESSIELSLSQLLFDQIKKELNSFVIEWDCLRTISRYC